MLPPLHSVQVRSSGTAPIAGLDRRVSPNWSGTAGPIPGPIQVSSVVHEVQRQLRQGEERTVGLHAAPAAPTQSSHQRARRVHMAVGIYRIPL